ncbi:MAG: hypothetical protein ACFB5Z_12010 [Elainellaceae cyanobacterium]
MTQSVLTFVLEALALGSASWLTTGFAIGLVNLWKRCDPATVPQGRVSVDVPQAVAPQAAQAQPVKLPELSKTARLKLGSEQPVDPDPDFDIELEDVGAIASFGNRFA